MPRLAQSLNIGCPTHIDGAEPWTSGIYKSPVLGRVRLSLDESRRRRPGRSQGPWRPRQSRVRLFRRSLSILARASWACRNAARAGSAKIFQLRDKRETGGGCRRHVPNRHGGRADLAAARAVLEARAPMESPRHAEAGRAERPHRLVSARAGNRRRRMRRCADACRAAVSRWTIDAVNAVAYSRGGTIDVDAARELADCPALAESWRGGFRNLVE